ncbi:MAG: type II toxin-antitoxin system VapC family toxin [Blastochloris sp.]|nr:type II toxin-antitoxin system VapC family toxin [Blastochloris sp.]
MYLLDTDHLSVLERGGAASAPLYRRLQAIAPTAVAATVVSYEEQTRGWFSVMAQARSLDEQVLAYRYLQRHLQVFCRVPLLAFDAAAVTIVKQLQQQRIRIGSMDLKIAGIALAQDATLVTRNGKDFQKVPELRIEDWTV